MAKPKLPVQRRVRRAVDVPFSCARLNQLQAPHLNSSHADDDIDSSRAWRSLNSSDPADGQCRPIAQNRPGEPVSAIRCRRSGVGEPVFAIWAAHRPCRPVHGLDINRVTWRPGGQKARNHSEAAVGAAGAGSGLRIRARIWTIRLFVS